MRWIECWVIGVAISVVVVIATVIATPLRAVSVYFVAPLFPGFLLSKAIRLNGPPLGWTFVIIWSIASVLSGRIVYGSLLYLMLRLRNRPLRRD